MTTLRLYSLLIRASIRSRMQYKWNFWLSTVLAAFINAMEFLLISLILWKFGSLKGWSLYEIGYLYATIMLSKTIYRSLANDVHHLEKYLISGDLDQLLIRPVPLLLALMSQNFRIMTGEYIQGGVILVLCLQGMMQAGQIGWWAVPQTAAVILIGSVILFAIGLGTATVGFWITRVSDLQNVTEDAAHKAVHYPMEIYPMWLRGILLTVIPVGVANYIPALYVLKGEFGAWLLPAACMFALLFLWAVLQFWKLGMTRYQSTGS
ncbi:MAG: family transporter [Paenibacillus sp.]|jgi:ABC-2 type transport system permease protein|nr:family transporter [Paenibacillus sp.]